MFIKPFHTGHNLVIRRSLIYTLGLLLAWATNISSPVFGVLVALPIAMQSRFSVEALLKRYAKQAFSLIAGTLIAEVFWGNNVMIFVMSLIIFYVFIFRVKYWFQVAFLPTIIFYYMFGVINSSYGISVEHSLYSLVQCVLIQMPLAWLLFKAFPVDTKDSSQKLNLNLLQFRSKVFSIIIVSLLLLLFLLIDFSTSVFCILVISSCAFSANDKVFLNNVKEIIPIQVGGCIIALFVNLLLCINTGNILWALFVLMIFTGFYLYFAINLHLRVASLDNVNFENNILRAALIPISLYTSSDSFSVTSYYHRGYDMIITATVMFIVYQLSKTVLERNTKAEPSV
ncbi:hypothetical protein VIN01S_26320 [Vibrio inusitatus NBRC 102082]|uniref:DUF2955 domain-containing protein n=1 Tax=Vibrio inusitatus NBRC 102082 TaxID=1219070 RepID=A0A4Y3HXU3_9VIBR|nr:hypothetical protein [Vibrio inusitatus]GEA51828.1 hypothetical protein VIN01S_26320 [Vibrio inusitatus NBRC 102082]